MLSADVENSEVAIADRDSNEVGVKTSSSECVSECDSGVNVNLNQSTCSATETVASNRDKEDSSGKQEDSMATSSPCSELEADELENEAADVPEKEIPTEAYRNEFEHTDDCKKREDSLSIEETKMDKSSNSEISVEEASSNSVEAANDDTPVEDPFSGLGLPPGWRRMTGDTGVYYWHVQSGEISRHIPEFHHSMSQPEKNNRLSAVGLSPEAIESLNIPESHSEGMLNVDEESISLSHSSSQELSKLVASIEMNQRNDMQSLVFPVFGLGSCTLDREDLKQDSSVAISSAIRYICQDSDEGQDDKFSGRDFLLVLENEALQVCDYLDNCVLLSIPVSQIRLWGVGKDSGHDFAFVSKDRRAGLHYCYAFRSDRSAKAISAALQKLCDKIVAERAAKRRSLPANPFLQPSFENAFWNDNERAPASSITEPAITSQATPLDKLSQKMQHNLEECERFNVYYIGSMPADKPSGIGSINEAIADLRDIGEEDYTAAVVHVSPSSILITNEENGELITESRVRYLSFLGIGKDACKFGYIVSTCRNQFICHVLHCPDSAGPLAKSVESACKVRYQKVLEAKKRQLLAAPKHTRQPTIPGMMSAISKTIQEAVSTSRQSTITAEDADDGPPRTKDTIADDSRKVQDSNNDAQQAQQIGQGSLRNSFSSLFGRLSRYTSSARTPRGSGGVKQRPKSQLITSTIAGSFEYSDD